MSALPNRETNATHNPKLCGLPDSGCPGCVAAARELDREFFARDAEIKKRHRHQEVHRKFQEVTGIPWEDFVAAILAALIDTFVEIVMAVQDERKAAK